MALKTIGKPLYFMQFNDGGSSNVFNFYTQAPRQNRALWRHAYVGKVRASVTPVFGLAVAFILLSVFLSICFGSDLSIVAFLERLSNNSAALNSVKLVSLSEVINKLNAITLPAPSLDIPVIGAIVDTLTRAVNGLLSAFIGFLKTGVFLIEGVDDIIRILLIFLQSIV